MTIVHTYYKKQTFNTTCSIKAQLFSPSPYGWALFNVCFAAVAATIWGKLGEDIKKPKEEKEKVDGEGLFLF